ncbi:DUF500-domain-containing protein [Tilletiaria anomala UBC 951]|uniref:DUF500-domain-containing protein n=1 Tax=Tilletiaria anomala (strain ATCC 24038 / CBS 436.72 / UBC 951) TaxID=1037660 RepID=A0A066VBM8_TILAU|nr:DUF500-domain-containing protein [Tilletiaria anomala UBC 951]KDN39162.1 DUF500-domain-containing protein [Tilletiaria anomala UBC 951]
MGNPFPVSLSQECRKAEKILTDFIDPVTGLDAVVPLSVLRKAQGFAIFSVFRIGALLSARAGSGVVLAKAEDGEWSPPAAVGLGGLGGGFNAGAEVTDFLIVLNSRAAVRSFMATGSLQLGGNLSLAVGPLGRSAEASGSLSTSGGAAAMFSYSKSKGLYGGVILEGTILVDRADANAKAYGRRSITSKLILSGTVTVPEFARPLLSTIERLMRNGGAVGAGMHGDFRNMGIGAAEDAVAGAADGALYDNFSRPVCSGVGRRSRPARENGDSSGNANRTEEYNDDDGGRVYHEEEGDFGERDSYDTPSRPVTMARQWSNSDRQQKNENETRNVGAYVFGRGSAAQDQNDPFADNAASTSIGRRMSPSVSRSYNNSGRSSRQRAGSRAASDYACADAAAANDPVCPPSTSAASSSSAGSRPKHHRKGSSFSFPSFRSGGGNSGTKNLRTTPTPPLANFQYDYDADRQDADVRSRNAVMNVNTAHTAASFPVQFNNGSSFSSGEEDEQYFTSSSQYHHHHQQQSDAHKPLGALSSSSSSSTTEHYSWEESDGGRDRERYFDAFDRELQQPKSANACSGYNTSGGGVADKRATPTLCLNGGSGSGGGRGDTRASPIASRSANNTSRSSFRTSSRADSRSETPIWARNLHFDDRVNAGGYARGLAAARGRDREEERDEENDPFYRTYYEARQEGMRRDLAGAGVRTKIQSYDPPPAGKPVRAPLPSDLSEGQPTPVPFPQNEYVIAQFDFGGAERGDLTFKRGDVIEVLRRTASREDWWDGKCRGRLGSFPANYTEDL